MTWNNIPTLTPEEQSKNIVLESSNESVAIDNTESPTESLQSENNTLNVEVANSNKNWLSNLDQSTRELTAEEQAIEVAKSEKATADFIQNSFIQEWADISADFNKSIKRMIDVNIQDSIIKYLSSYFNESFISMNDALKALENNNLHLNVLPSKLQFWKYKFKIEILSKIDSKEFNIDINADLNISE